MHSMVYTIHIFGTTVCTRNESSNRESSIKPSRKQMSEISFAVWCTRGYAVLKKKKKLRRKKKDRALYWHSMTAVTNLSE